MEKFLDTQLSILGKSIFAVALFGLPCAIWKNFSEIGAIIIQYDILYGLSLSCPKIIAICAILYLISALVMIISAVLTLIAGIIVGLKS